MMTTSIYDQHDAAFARVSAYVITKTGARVDPMKSRCERVATIAFKFPADGAGRLYAYVHWIGEPMVRGFAGGYGYDKKSAACARAAPRLDTASMAAHIREARAREHSALEVDRLLAVHKDWTAFRDAIANGADWSGRLGDAGFTVLQAV